MFLSSFFFHIGCITCLFLKDLRSIFSKKKKSKGIKMSSTPLWNSKCSLKLKENLEWRTNLTVLKELGQKLRGV